MCAGLLIAALAAGSAAASPVGVDPTGDAEGDYVAVSGTGDARAGGACDYAPPPLDVVPCAGLLALSLTGSSAAQFAAVTGGNDADGLVAVCAADPAACVDRPDVPPPSDVTLVVPTHVEVGPDEDADGVPAWVRVAQASVTASPATGDVDVAPASARTVDVDFNDRNARSPVPDPEDYRPTGVAVLVPDDVEVGPDADGDGVPSRVVVHYTIVVVDLETGDVRVIEDRSLTLVPDSDDDDASRPVPRAPSTVSARVPTAVVPGPDADGDGVPASVMITSTTFRVDAEDGDVTPGESTMQRVSVDPDDGAREAHATVSEDADATLLAASALGDARSCMPSVTCAAVSGTGDADGYYAITGTGDATACEDVDFLCTAVAGTGNARGDDLAASGTGNAEGGDAAVSGTGDADGTLPVSALGACNGRACVAVATEPGEDADAHWLAIAPTGDASGLIAVSLVDDADGGLVAVSVFENARGPVTASLCDAAGACEGM